MSGMKGLESPLPKRVRVGTLHLAWRAFGDGLVRPTRWSLLIAILVAILVSTLCANVVDETWMTRHGQWFSAGEGDARADVTLRALSMRTAAPQSKPLLVLAGHAIPLPMDQEPRAERSQRRSGDGCELIDLRTPRQTLYESFSLLDQIPSSAAGRVLFMATPESFGGREDAHSEMVQRTRIGVRSASASIDLMHQGVAVVPLRGNYFVDNQSYLLSRAPIAVENALNRMARRNIFDPSRHLVEEAPRVGDDDFPDLATIADKIETLGRLLDRLDFLGFPRTVVIFHSDPKHNETELHRRLEELVRSREGEFIWSEDSGNVPADVPYRVVADLRERLGARVEE